MSSIHHALSMGNYTSGCGKESCRSDSKDFHNAKTFGKRRVELRRENNDKQDQRRKRADQVRFTSEQSASGDYSPNTSVFAMGLFGQSTD